MILAQSIKRKKVRAAKGHGRKFQGELAAFFSGIVNFDFAREAEASFNTKVRDIWLSTTY